MILHPPTVIVLQVGLVPGEDFSTHWWTSVFNKAVSNISVDNSGVSCNNFVSYLRQRGSLAATV